jgi:hypothetical protein
MDKIKEGDIQWVHCNQCRRKTQQEVIKIREVNEDEEVDASCGWIDWLTTYTMLECRGCAAVTLRRRTVSQTIGEDETTYYPPPISRQIPRWHYDLPKDIKELLKECYAALQSGSKRLAIMGARSVVEIFMNKSLGDIGGFKQKLNKLVEKGYLTRSNRDTLEAALEAGHAVVHRGHTPKADDVTLVFDIVENLFHALILKKESEQLKERTPIRKKSNKPEAGDNL